MTVWSRLLQKLESYDRKPCLIQSGSTLTYIDCLEQSRHWKSRFESANIPAGAVVALEGNLSVAYLPAFIGALHHGCIVLPIGDGVHPGKRQSYLDAGQVEWCCQPETENSAHVFRQTGNHADHPLIGELRATGNGGLVLCTSGTTGTPKAVLHSAERFFNKFLKANKGFRTLAFFDFDHMAGMDAVWYGLASGSTLVLPEGRSPEAIAKVVERHQVEVLPASPTFLNLLMMSGVLNSTDLSSLKIVTYGSEPMPEPVLDRLQQALPQVKLIQKFGMSELGSPPSKSKSEDSLWIKIASDELKIKSVDGILWIHSPYTMMGYLNAPSPIDAEGWLNTGDRVDIDGEYVRFKGRDSDWINVGGEKVDPLTVEAVLLKADNVKSAVVKGEAHPMMGNIVIAKICLDRPEEAMQARHRLQAHCRQSLAPYQIPVKFSFTDKLAFTDRFKQQR